MRGALEKVTHAFALGTTIASQPKPEVGLRAAATTHFGGLNSGEHYKGADERTREGGQIADGDVQG